MANVATEITGHGLVLCQKRENNKIRVFRCTFDTLSSDLLILAADAARNHLIVGIQYSSPNAHLLILKSGASQRVGFNLPADSGMSKEVGRPMFVTDKNSALNLQVQTGLISDLLLFTVSAANFAIGI